MIVKNKSKRCIRVNKVVLKPGSNLLNKAQVEDFNKSIDFAERLVENGVLSVPDVSKEKPVKQKAAPVEDVDEDEDDVTTVADMNAKDAIALVNDTVDKAALELFMEQETDREEPRVTVVRAIEHRVEEIIEAQQERNDTEDEENDE